MRLGSGQGVALSPDGQSASFSVSRTGVLAFRGGELAGGRMLWLDRSGKESPLLDASADYGDRSLSPDGSRIVYAVTEGGGSGGDLWIRDLSRGVSSRFTFDAAAELTPIWSPDGRRIAYTSRGKAAGDLYVKDASGTREAEPLLVDKEEKYISDWSPDGRYILYTSRDGGPAGWNVMALPTGGDRKPFPVAQTQFAEMWATFSPDGKYIAYQSNESGRQEIYVHEFPEACNKWQVSTEGGSEPFWRHDGHELFYRQGSRVIGVPVDIGETFKAGNPVTLFQARFASAQVRARIVPTPDGQRFLALGSLSRDAEQPASVVLNWVSALRR